MVTDLLFIKAADGSWRPADSTSWERSNKLPQAVLCHADIKNPQNRSGRQHAYAFALMSQLYQNQDTYKSFDHFRSALLIVLGECEWYETKALGRVPVAKSLAYGKMTADEFNAFVDKVLDFAESLGWDRAELLKYTRDM